MPQLFMDRERRAEIKEALLAEIKDETPMEQGSIGYLSDLFKVKEGEEVGEDHPLMDVIEYFQLSGWSGEDGDE